MKVHLAYEDDRELVSTNAVNKSCTSIKRTPNEGSGRDLVLYSAEEENTAIKTDTAGEITATSLGRKKW